MVWRRTNKLVSACCGNANCCLLSPTLFIQPLFIFVTNYESDEGISLRCHITVDSDLFIVIEWHSIALTLWMAHYCQVLLWYGYQTSLVKLYSYIMICLFTANGCHTPGMATETTDVALRRATLDKQVRPHPMLSTRQSVMYKLLSAHTYWHTFILLCLHLEVCYSLAYRSIDHNNKLHVLICLS